MSGLGQSSFNQAAGVAAAGASAPVTPDVPISPGSARYEQEINFKACYAYRSQCSFTSQSPSYLFTWSIDCVLRTRALIHLIT